MSPLATAETLFRAYFLPLYPPDARADLARARAEDANPARNPAIFAHLDEAAALFAARAPVLFAGGEPVELAYSDASVHRLSKAIPRDRRDGWVTRGAAGTPESEIFNVVVHGAAYVGECARRGTQDPRSAVVHGFRRLKREVKCGHAAVR